MVTRRSVLKVGLAGGVAAVSGGTATLFDSVSAAPGPNGDPRVFTLNAQTLATVRDRVAAGDPGVTAALKVHTNWATRLLNESAPSVTQKDRLPPSGDKHDYLSIGRYTWPDPTKPDGLPWIMKDGVVNPDVVALPDQENLIHVITWLYPLSEAYTYTGDERFATQAANLLRTWFLNPETRMNPNLNYAANWPGRTDGEPSGTIDTSGFGRMIDNIGLIEHSPAWTDDDKAGIRDWMSQYLNWLLTSDFGKRIANGNQNISTWYDVQVVALARFVGRDDLAQQVLQESVGKRIATQIEPDGRQPQELARTTSFHYSLFNLTAFCNLASLGANMNIDLWNAQAADGRSIHKALDFVLPYLLGQQAWPYQQITTFDYTEFDTPLRQAAAGYGSGSYWDAADQIAGDNAMKMPGRLEYIRPG